jgi:hypothetical protein
MTALTTGSMRARSIETPAMHRFVRARVVELNAWSGALKQLGAA